MVQIGTDREREKYKTVNIKRTETVDDLPT